MGITAKLEQHRVVKVKGVGFVIRKLAPSLFMDKDYMLPISHVMEIKDKKDQEKAIENDLETFRSKMRDVILRGCVGVKTLFSVKPIEKNIDTIMEQPEIYGALFTAIVNHTLSVKKKPLN